MVHETHRNYRDSTGQEQIGVSRRIGDRGRSIVAERRGDGTEQRTDNLINVNDGTQFDREWRGNAAATQINQARTQMAQLTQGRGADPFGMPPTGLLGGGGHATHHQRPTLTNEDREAARAGARRHEADRARIIDEARRQREGGGAPQPAQIGYSGGRPPSYRGGGGGGGGGGDAAMASRLAREEARRAGMY